MAAAATLIHGDIVNTLAPGLAGLPDLVAQVGQLLQQMGAMQQQIIALTTQVGQAVQSADNAQAARDGALLAEQQKQTRLLRDGGGPAGGRQAA